MQKARASSRQVNKRAQGRAVNCASTKTPADECQVCQTPASLRKRRSAGSNDTRPHMTHFHLYPEAESLLRPAKKPRGSASGDQLDRPAVHLAGLRSLRHRAAIHLDPTPTSSRRNLFKPTLLDRLRARSFLSTHVWFGVCVWGDGRVKPGIRLIIRSNSISKFKV